jgi:uncharacterized protein
MTTIPDTSTGSTSTAELAVVTGASSGIGLSLARQFLQHGFDVIAVAEDDELASAADTLTAEGGSVTAVRADLATEAGVETTYEAIRTDGRPVAAAALNAGIGVGGGRFDQTPLEDDLRLADLNVRSTVHLAKLLVRDMVARGDGRLLFTSSIAAKAPGPYHATYAASKAFVHSFAEGIRHELKDTGVVVTSLMPGPTDTEFFDRANMEDSALGGSSKKDDPEDVARDGYEALMAGKDHVVAGSSMNKAQTASGQALPDKAAAAVQAKMTKPRGD